MFANKGTTNVDIDECFQKANAIFCYMKDKLLPISDFPLFSISQEPKVKNSIAKF
jgi:hypothetical protein